MFHYDRGLTITSIDLAIDVRRRRPRGFVSHAHADHMGPHELAICTPQTAAFYRHRLGAHRAVSELPFGEPRQFGDLQLTALAAGHILGAAMLLVEHSEQSLLYTGDFRMRPSLTAARAEPRAADVLIMETTFGRPKYRFPPRKSAWDQLTANIDAARKDGRTPVIRAYTLGKSQEVTRALTDRGYAVMQHPLTFQISRIYEQLGCPLGDVRQFCRHDCEEFVIVTPPRAQRGAYLELPARKMEIAVTGWAMDYGAKFRLNVDEAISISDHADYDELLECVERVAPRRIYCTHGDSSFCEHLREKGLDAHMLGAETYQQRLF